MNCNYSNDKLSDTEIYRIENQCKLQNHIDNSESLLNIIKADEAYIYDNSFTFQQLKNFFEKIKLHYNHNNNNKEINVNEQIREKINQMIIGGNGWCCREINIANIFADQFTVIKISFGGSEECPFKSPDDKKYRGYEYGSHDWIFVNNNTEKIMHIGDLLFHQITEHHFFQGSESKYRIDPKNLINFFGLKKDLSYESDIEITYYWSEKRMYTKIKHDYPETYYSPDIKSEYDSYIRILLPDFNPDSDPDPDKYGRTEYGKNIIVKFNNHIILYKNDYGDIPYQINGIMYIMSFSAEDKEDVNKNKQSGNFAIGIYLFEKKQFTKITDNEMKFLL
jgi:hypothetical protein